MTKTRYIGVALFLSVSIAQARAELPTPTIAASPSADELRQPQPLRARGIPAALAVEAALEANAVCLQNTYKTTAMITDSAGVPIVMISNDGAAAITQRVAMGKIQAVLKYRMTSGEIAERAKTDAALGAEIKANPMIDTARQGALPIKVGNDIVGAIAVSGAPGGDKDEVCARAGLTKIQKRLF